MTHKHQIPTKINSYLRRLYAEYTSSGQALLAEILDAARILVVEETEYDGWNGGTYGHDVKLFLPIQTLTKFRAREQKPISEEILKDLNACAESVSNEFFRSISFETEDNDDNEFQQARPFSQRPQVNPDMLSIWRAGHIRLFISHRDTHKKAAKALADALEGYGISAFVAHDTIAPMETWQSEIEKGLETMEVMLAFITDDFHKSIWTNQEIGFALGRNVPIVSLKLESSDPSGFIGKIQGLPGRMDKPESYIPKLYEIMADKLGNRKRLQSALISAFIESRDFSETKVRFDRLVRVVETLSDDEVLQISQGFNSNDQLHRAGHLTSQYQRLKKFLESTTQKKFTVQGTTISVVKEVVDDDLPF